MEYRYLPSRNYVGTYVDIPEYCVQSHFAMLFCKGTVTNVIYIYICILAQFLTLFVYHEGYVVKAGLL